MEKLQQNKVLKLKKQKSKTMNESIIITPVSMSGVGNYVEVIIGENRYKTDIVQGEFTEDVMKELMNKLITNQIPAEQQEAVELKFYQLLDAIVNTEAEEEYRAQHPEEFMPKNFEPSVDVEEVTDEII